MLIDILVAIIIILACIKGYRKGLIVGVFSFLAFIIGLAAALKLSAYTANHLQKDINVSSRWLPFVTFLLIFLLAALAVYWVARLIEKVVKMVMLGWINRLGGIIFYLLIYLLAFSALFFYIEKLHLVSKAAIGASKTYPYIKSFGQKAINGIGKLVPVFKDVFNQLEDFFAALPQKIPN